MHAVTTLVDRPDFTVRRVRCREDHTRWSAPEPVVRYGLVLVRRGAFRRRGPDGTGTIDPTMGYLNVPGSEEQFAHPAGGDECTAIGVSPDLWHGLVAERPTPAALYVDARVDLAHRLMLRGAPEDPDFAAAEHLLRLLAAAVRGTADRTGSWRTGRDRALVDGARDALRAGHPAAVGLVPLARLLDVSPYRLSRSFRAEVGVSLTRYRNRLRVGRAVEALQRGADDLAGLAAELGFADQAHLTRTMRQHLDHPPGRLRHLLR
ncbi:helix-turn-helix domain-containing protein [Plantactinospora sp. GCM10030261]|uniref:helix-turn-helix domain-containing protein n=1 Tax=Plantactinospora sp. GCM10030261 TaxID=3273420 RepID=UPI00362119C3